VSFNPDGDLLAVGGCQERMSTQRLCASGGLVLIWRWEKGNQPEPQLCCAADNVGDTAYSLAFNREGSILAVGTSDGTIRRWNIPSFESIDPPLHGHSKSVRRLLFPNDDTLISVSNDSTVLKWDLTQPDDEPVVLTNPSVPQSAELSPDSHWVALGQAYGGKIQIGSVDPENLVDLVCLQVERNLTQAEWDQFAGDRLYQRTCPDLPVGEGAPDDAPDAQYIRSRPAGTTVRHCPGVANGWVGR